MKKEMERKYFYANSGGNQLKHKLLRVVCAHESPKSVIKRRIMIIKVFNKTQLSISNSSHLPVTLIFVFLTTRQRW